MDNALFYCYLAFMFLIPTLSALGGRPRGLPDPLSPLQHGPRPLRPHRLAQAALGPGGGGAGGGV